ncbi:phosphate signaling complex protein PhoU [Pararhodospirillum oryzae]|uniref:Phosphate-specific transport system accessory protein PhoU n=1 Tax=Pararhodospirillum oryzae TaxID=478448 RepID=A0A512H5X1_9PROT|nr:phosphate signaling complex protein PhoU [Pararhodospirillum oryzae]GEO80843.1 phosphate transport system regulatory protein PhoU [Pararhodospirillum oryzae]
MTVSKNAHIVTSYDDNLRLLYALLDRMGALAISQTRDTIALVVQRAPETAERILEHEAEMNELDVRVNEQVIRLLALRQPLADDLRGVVSGLKVASMLERIGDYSANAARRAPAIANLSAFPVRGPVSRMGDLVIGMLDDALRAFRDPDPALAALVRERDEEVDALHASLFRELLTYMMEDPRTITACTHLMFVSKNLERIGDQATNIAEAAHYRATGCILSGERPKGDTSSSLVWPDGDGPGEDDTLS